MSDSSSRASPLTTYAIRAPVSGIIGLRRRIDDDRIRAGQAVEEALDLVRADLHRHVLRERVPTPGGIPTRAAGMDEVQLVARDHDLIDLERHPVVEPLDGDADEGVLVVGVEHVAQPVGLEDGPAQTGCSPRRMPRTRPRRGSAGRIRPPAAGRTPPAGGAVSDPSCVGWCRDAGSHDTARKYRVALASRA